MVGLVLNGIKLFMCFLKKLVYYIIDVDFILILWRSKFFIFRVCFFSFKIRILIFI